jgi:uncharacterized protein YcbX
MAHWLLDVFSGILNIEQSAYGFVVAAAVFFALFVVRKRIYQTARRREVGVISELYVYPVKSCKGIKVASSECTVRGLKYDRCWVVVDRQGQFLTQKQQSTMARISQQLQMDEVGQAVVTLSAPDMPNLKLTSHLPDDAQRTQVKVYRMSGEGVDCGSEAGEWFSTYLKVPGCRVYYMPNYCQPRQLTTDSKYGHVAQQKDEVSFADFAPYLIISKASLSDLNSRMDKPLSIRSFRPNIVVSGPAPFEEDSWKKFAIGEALFRKLKECGRCILTTLDPDTGEKSGEEPLKTLRSYRLDDRYGVAPKFGMHASLDRVGTIAVGDSVFVYEE